MEEKIFVTQSSMPTYEEYIEAIKPLWESYRLTNMGQYHQELEKQLKVYLDVPEISLIFRKVLKSLQRHLLLFRRRMPLSATV